MYPSLVEPSIKYILHSELKNCKEKQFITNSFYLNIISLLFIISFVGFILWLQYKGKQDIKTKIENDKKRKNYILSKLQNYQKMKQRAYTNMPI
jgi:hypothetical protein